jgi:hypothetical protein
MNTSTATADALLRQADMRLRGMSLRRLASRDLDRLFHVCLDHSGLRVPVAPGVLAVSSRTVMNMRVSGHTQVSTSRAIAMGQMAFR